MAFPQGLDPIEWADCIKAAINTGKVTRHMDFLSSVMRQCLGKRSHLNMKTKDGDGFITHAQVTWVKRRIIENIPNFAIEYSQLAKEEEEDIINPFNQIMEK